MLSWSPAAPDAARGLEYGQDGGEGQRGQRHGGGSRAWHSDSQVLTIPPTAARQVSGRRSSMRQARPGGAARSLAVADRAGLSSGCELRPGTFRVGWCRASYPLSDAAAPGTPQGARLKQSRQSYRRGVTSCVTMPLHASVRMDGSGPAGPCGRLRFDCMFHYCASLVMNRSSVRFRQAAPSIHYHYHTSDQAILLAEDRLGPV
jgi:hypothetical protein